jgi:hypothetical protein
VRDGKDSRSVGEKGKIMQGGVSERRFISGWIKSTTFLEASVAYNT